MVIELDGAQHYEKNAMEYDKVRTEYLKALDIQVIRFSNTDIKQRFLEVCKVIDAEVHKRLM